MYRATSLPDAPTAATPRGRNSRRRPTGARRRPQPATESRLAEDVARAIDAVGSRSSRSLVGHSIAGEELHVLGARHSAKLAGVVYIDAAFNRADGSDGGPAAMTRPRRTLPPAPRPGPGDLASYAASFAFVSGGPGARPARRHCSPRAVCRQRRRNRRWSRAMPNLPDPSGTFTRKYRPRTRHINPDPIRLPALGDVRRAGIRPRRPRCGVGVLRGRSCAVRDAVQERCSDWRERFGHASGLRRLPRAVMRSPARFTLHQQPREVAAARGVHVITRGNAPTVDDPVRYRDARRSSGKLTLLPEQPAAALGQIIRQPPEHAGVDLLGIRQDTTRASPLRYRRTNSTSCT